MTPRDVFEAHYRSAEVLLRVHRLLESDDGPQRDHELIPRLRDVIRCTRDEEVILLLNQLFVGVVREQAGLNLLFFRRDTLDLLLRQSVVAACSALDVIVPHLLETYLPAVIRVRQRNFLPNDGEVREVFRGFSLKLDDIWPLAEEDDRDARWGMIARRVLDYCGNQTLSNERGIAAGLALLGIEKPWGQIASRAGEDERSLRGRLVRAVARRNDIVHRADRAKTDPQGPAQAIDYVWTDNHVGAVRTIALACCDLGRERVTALEAEASVTMEV